MRMPRSSSTTEVDESRRSNAQLSSINTAAADTSLHPSVMPHDLETGSFGSWPTQPPMLDSCLRSNLTLTPTSSVSTNLSYAQPLSQPAPQQQNAWGQVCAVLCRNGSDNMLFQCRFGGCERKSYKRFADFMRHYKGNHAIVRQLFWCPNGECTRSQRYGNVPFERSDKRDEHVKKVHRITPQ